MKAKKTFEHIRSCFTYGCITIISIIIIVLLVIFGFNFYYRPRCTKIENVLFCIDTGKQIGWTSFDTVIQEGFPYVCGKYKCDTDYSVKPFAYATIKNDLIIFQSPNIHSDQGDHYYFYFINKRSADYDNSDKLCDSIFILNNYIHQKYGGNYDFGTLKWNSVASLFEINDIFRKAHINTKRINEIKRYEYENIERVKIELKKQKDTLADTPCHFERIINK